VKASRAKLCKHLESIGRLDLKAESWKRQAVPYVAIGATLVLCTGVTMGLGPALPLVQTFGPWAVGVGAALALGGGGLYLAGSAGDVIDRRYQGLLYMLADESWAAATNLDLNLSTRRRPGSPDENWGRLSGQRGPDQFKLQLSTRYWTETDTMQEEQTYEDDDGTMRTRTRTIVVHRREFEQDTVRLLIQRPDWDAARLKRHFSVGPSRQLTVSEVQAERGQLEAEFVSGVARTVSGEGMAVEEIDHDQLLDSSSLLAIFRWVQEGEDRAANPAG